MVRVDGPVDRAWSVHEVTLEDVILAHLADGKAEGSNTARGADMIWLTWRQHRKQALFLPAALTALAAVLTTLYLSQTVR